MTESGHTAVKALGAALRGQRLAAGLSLRQLARQVGLSGHGTLVDYELGRRVPPEDLLIACERVLGVPEGGLQALRRDALAERGAREAAALLAPPLEELAQPPEGLAPPPEELAPHPEEDAPPTQAEPAAVPRQPRPGVEPAPSAGAGPVPTAGVEAAPSAGVEPAARVAEAVGRRRPRPRLAMLSPVVLVAVLLGAAVVGLSDDVPAQPDSCRVGHASPSPVPAGACGPSPTAAAQMGFERPGERWWLFWGSQVARVEVTTSVAYEGTHAFLVTVTGASARKGYSAVGIAHDLTGLRPGMGVTMHLWTSRPGGTGVRFFAMDSASKVVWAPQTIDTEVTLPASPGWSSVVWTVPAVDRVHAIGMQIYSETDDPLLVAVDSVSW